MYMYVSSVRRRLNAHELHVRVSVLGGVSVTVFTNSLLIMEMDCLRRRRKRESVVPANLCKREDHLSHRRLCDQERARQREATETGKGGQTRLV